MANRGPEVELLSGGTEVDAPSKGSVALNLLRRQNAWEVRKGFGQVAQIDTLMSSWMHKGSTSDADWAATNGYKKVLGSTMMTTASGYRHILTVLASTNRTGSVVQDVASTVTPLFVVSIYDVDTGGRWEEPVYRHTSEEEDVQGLDITNRHGVYESVADRNYARFTRSPSNVDSAGQMWFAELNDILYFGNSEMGMYAYLPAPLRKMRRRHLSTQYRKHARVTNKPLGVAGTAPPYSECSFIKRVPAAAPSTNAAAAYAYLTGAAFPKPSAGCRFGSGLALADGKTVYITDGGFPNAIKALNTASITTDETIRAMHELNGNLYIFTDSETWFLQPSDGALSVLGRKMKIAEGVGCSGPTAVVKAGQTLLWMDSRGAYKMTGVASYDRISDFIEPFFTDELSNPLNNFFTANGHISAAALSTTSGWGMPRSFYRYSADMVCAAYNERLDIVMFSFPALNAILAYTEGQWAVWPLESIARETSNTPTVGSLDNIMRPWVMADHEDIFVTCGVEAQTLTDVGPGTAYTGTNRSIAHLRYGRGGAVDRSVEDEDYRMGMGGYVHTAAASAAGAVTKALDGGFYLHEAIPIQDGRVFEGTPSVTVDRPAYWIPVEMVKPSADVNAAGAVGAPTLIQDFHLTFTFDNTNWEPIYTHTTNAVVNAMFPPERASTTNGYALAGGAPSATRQFRVYDGASVDATGNWMKINFDGSASGSGALSPYINIAPHQRNRMFYITMKRKAGAALTNYTVGFSIAIVQAQVVDGRGVEVNMPCWVWEGAYLGGQRVANNSKAQPVDWAYKSAPYGALDDKQHKGRGTYTKMLSHGKAMADHRVSPNWPVGLYNTVVASDFKGWTTQIIDVAPTQTDAAKAVSQVLDTDTLRTRYQGASSLNTKVFGTASSANHVHYGSASHTGTIADVYLIDNEEVDVVAMSTSVKGAHITYMVWGMLRNKAERLVLESVKAVVRAVGGRRRDGH